VESARVSSALMEWGWLDASGCGGIAVVPRDGSPGGVTGTGCPSSGFGLSLRRPIRQDGSSRQPQNEILKLSPVTRVGVNLIAQATFDGVTDRGGAMNRMTESTGTAKFSR
jgi:hypothetical protein